MGVLLTCQRDGSRGVVQRFDWESESWLIFLHLFTSR